MIKIGIIGAGAICYNHLDAYSKNSDCKVVAISDVNHENAKKRAEQFGIEKVYTDYFEILNDKEIDAVSIVTPTFTHKQIVLDALKAGKHVLCEKPPALTAEETQELADAAKESGKLLMFGMVCRFRRQSDFIKTYVESGKMGKIVSAEAVRAYRALSMGGWFVDKEKSGGGPLRDAAIHELDSLLYFMGYPKPVSVSGVANDAGKTLPARIKGMSTAYNSLDKNKYENTIENFASGFVKFEDGSSLFIKTCLSLPVVTETTFMELSGETAGIKFTPGGELEVCEVTEENYIQTSKPTVSDVNPFYGEINHFVDCVANGTECIVKPCEAVTLMAIIDAIYKSAETGETVYFD